MKKIILVRRYDPNNIDQEFMDLELARLDYESKMQEDNKWAIEEKERMQRKRITKAKL